MKKVDVKIAVIGGGTGSFTLLSQLKRYTNNISALVNMADDGGSTGVLRDELGVLPPGDVRQCLVALGESERLRELFSYRFEEGTFEGHAFGNLFLTALEKMTGSFASAVETAADVLKITGEVHPVTLDKVTLVMKQANGMVTEGEFKIGDADFGSSKRPEMTLAPKAELNPDARDSIMQADLVVIAPGNMYGSLAPALIVPGMSEALNATPAKKVYVCNLVTKPGQTDDFDVTDFAAEIERFGKFELDYVLYNNQKPSSALLDKYAKEGEFGVKFNDKQFTEVHYKAIGGNFISSQRYEAKASDPIASSRTLIRHDAHAVAKALVGIYLKGNGNHGRS